MDHCYLALLPFLLTFFSFCPESARQYRQSSSLSGKASAQPHQPICCCHDVICPGQWKQTEPRDPLQVCLPRYFCNIKYSKMMSWGIVSKLSLFQVEHTVVIQNIFVCLPQRCPTGRHLRGVFTHWRPQLTLSSLWSRPRWACATCVRFTRMSCYRKHTTESSSMLPH